MLDNGTLRQMISDMNRQMDSGLAGGLQTSSIAMLPSFVPKLPDGSGELTETLVRPTVSSSPSLIYIFRFFIEVGKYLAIDLGGTNLRVLLMDLRPVEEDEPEIPPESRNFRIPNSAMTGTGEEVIIQFFIKVLDIL